MTPDYITELKDTEIFVFGSNRNGNHAGGAARQAKEDFGAEMGVGEGITGQCYALPTLNEKMERDWTMLIQAAANFIDCADRLPDFTFYLTKVGCGIAGYPEEEVKKLFQDTPGNVVKPEGW